MAERKTIRLAALAVAGLAVLGAGCGSNSTTGPIRFTVQVFATPASISATGTTTIIAQVTNNLAQPATGALLEWSTNFGSLRSGSSVTDASGRATATLSGDGTPGVAVVSAKILNSGERGQVEVRIGLD